MKNLRILAMVALAITFGACSSDDNSDNNNNSGGIEGTYELREFNTSVATDFDEDGTASTNQVNESDCYNDVQIALRSDNTFTYTIGYISVNTDGSDTCTSYEVDGTWTATNNTITATYENIEGNDVTVSFARTDNGNTLTETRTITTFPNRNAEGAAIQTVGSVQLVFKK